MQSFQLIHQFPYRIHFIYLSSFLGWRLDLCWTLVCITLNPRAARLVRPVVVWVVHRWRGPVWMIVGVVCLVHGFVASAQHDVGLEVGVVCLSAGEGLFGLAYSLHYVFLRLGALRAVDLELNGLVSRVVQHLGALADNRRSSSHLRTRRDVVKIFVFLVLGNISSLPIWLAIISEPTIVVVWVVVASSIIVVVVAVIGVVVRPGAIPIVSAPVPLEVSGSSSLEFERVCRLGPQVFHLVMDSLFDLSLDELANIFPHVVWDL